MKHKNQRTINRLLFLAGILIPSILIGGTLALRHTELGQDWLRRQWVDELSHATNSQVEIGHIHFLQPGRYAFENVRISDEESGRLICQANHIEVDHSDKVTDLKVHTLQIPDTSPVIWINWWNEHVLSIAQHHQLNIKIGLTMLNDLPMESFHNTTAQFEWSSESSKLTVNWGMQQEPIALQLTRTHLHPIASTLLLQTNGNELAMTAINEALPLQVELGEKATFNGQLISKYHPGRFTSDIDFAAEGEIKNIELSKTLGQSGKSAIDGLATLTITRAVCNGNQWQRLQGSIIGGQGTIAREWLPTLASKLQLRWLGDLQEETVPYESLHCEFAWDPSGFTLRGESEGAHIGTILRHKNGPILGDRPESVIHAATLSEALQR